MAKPRKKQKKELGKGGIAALIIAGIALVAILVGVVYFVQSGGAGVSESAGLISVGDNQTVANESEDAADDGSVEVDPATTTKKGDKVSAEDVIAEAEENSEKAANTPKNNESDSSTDGIVYKSKATAKQLAQYYDEDIDAFRKAYDGKTVTVTGKLASKSSKMLYVELTTGTKVPMRVYINGEDEREKFSDLKKGATITVKGNVGVLYPQSMDNGGLQEMANGLIAIDTATLVS